MEKETKKLIPEKGILKTLHVRHAEAEIILEGLERLSKAFTPAIREESLVKMIRRATYHARCLTQDLKFCLDVCLEQEIEEAKNREEQPQVALEAT